MSSDRRSLGTIRWVTVDGAAASPRAPVARYLIEKFHALCREEFSVNELEEVEVWHRRIEDAGKTAPYCQSFLLATDAEDGPDGWPTVLAGSARELYRDCGCVFVSYVVVAASLRGQGVARRMMVDSFEALSRSLGRPLSALFADIAQVRDHSDLNRHAFSAAARQEVWRRIGFVPLNFDLVFPGRLRGGRYHLALLSHPTLGDSRKNVADDSHAETELSGVSATTLRQFVTGLFRGILMEECEDDASLNDIVQRDVDALHDWKHAAFIHANPDGWK